MSSNDEDEIMLREIERIVKPKISSILLLSLICIGPFGNLIFNIIIKEYDRLLVTAMFTFPTLIIIGFSWCHYLYKLKNYKDISKDIYEEIRK